MKKRISIFHLLIGSVIFFCCEQRRDPETGEKEMVMTTEELGKIERGDPSAPGSVVFTKSEFGGMKLFMRHCNRCHPGGEKGEGPALNDKPLPDFLIHFQVRKGLGDMPEFSKEEISKEQLKEIILFVRLLRDTK
jgi:hypothetical protein